MGWPLGTIFGGPLRPTTYLTFFLSCKNLFLKSHLIRLSLCKLAIVNDAGFFVVVI